MKLICFLCCAVALMAGCNRRTDGKASSGEVAMEAPLKVEVNYNVETLGIIFSLAADSDWLLEHSNKSEDSYLIKLYRERFKDFKGHAAVKALDSLAEGKMLGINHPYLGLHYSALPAYELVAPLPASLYGGDKKRAEVDAELGRFAGLVRQFYKDAGLGAFFQEKAAFYAGVQKEVEASLPDQAFFRGLKEFYGDADGVRLKIVPSPVMFGQWGFGHSVRTDSGWVYYQLLSHGEERPYTTWEAVVIDSGLGFGNADYNFEFAVHEFGHSFVRFLDSAEAQAQIATLTYMNTPEISAAMEEQWQDTSWANVFEEHLVRSIEVLMLEKMGKKEAAAEKIRVERDENGFVYVERFLEGVRKYDGERGRYGDGFEGYLGVLVEGLKEGAGNAKG